jgi:dTDP-4-amino-4,6-dideoxygalactose transaminase
VWNVLIPNSLKEKDIPSVSYYLVPLRLQPVFKNLGRQAGDFPVAEKVAINVSVYR